MRFKVPQKIDMEDKVIGPLTMRQFVYLMVGGMIFYATIKTENFSYIIIIGTPCILLALCLAFIKIQDQPFSKFLLSLVFFIIKPRFRIWEKDWQKEGAGTPIVQKVKKEEDKTSHKVVKKEELRKLSIVLDTKGQEKIKAFQQKQKKQ